MKLKPLVSLLCSSRLFSKFEPSQQPVSCLIRKKMASDASVNEVTEGLAKVELPQSVFYNPVQEFNRDLTVAVISEYAQNHIFKSRNDIHLNKSKLITGDLNSGEKSENLDLQSGKYYEDGVRIFEGLAASGLRSVRFGLEIPGVKEVIANDFDDNAVEYIKRNIQKNGLEHLMKAKCGDAAMGMYENRDPDKRFDVIDLDPYGSPSVFLDAAVQGVHPGGLLCITCTDAAVLCGNALEKCNAAYGAVSLRSKFCHEMAIRIILQSLDTHANRYGRYIEPLLSLSIDFYFRVFVQVFRGPRNVKLSATKRAMVFECTGCGTHDLQPLASAVPTKGEGNYKFMPGSGPVVNETCEHCGHGHRFGGPVWSPPIHNQDFVKRVVARVEESPARFGTSQRIIGMLNVVLEELPNKPMYYILDTVCNVLHCSPPPMKLFRSSLLNAGYRVSLSHAAKNSYKTDAPANVIWDIMRTWIKDNPVHERWLVDGSVAKAILEKPITTEVSFEEHEDSNPASRERGLLRWQPNPEPYWGPRAKAKRSHNPDHVNLEEKRATNQGKRQKTLTIMSLQTSLSSAFLRKSTSKYTSGSGQEPDKLETATEEEKDVLS